MNAVLTDEQSMSWEYAIIPDRQNPGLPRLCLAFLRAWGSVCCLAEDFVKFRSEFFGTVRVQVVELGYGPDQKFGLFRIKGFVLVHDTKLSTVILYDAVNRDGRIQVWGGRSG
jgi:hypothetical protein